VIDGWRKTYETVTRTIPNLVAWLDADRIEGITGDAINSWEDQSGNNNHMASDGGTDRPLLQKDSLNGHAVLQFDGTDDGMQFTTSLSISRPYTIFIVNRYWKTSPQGRSFQSRSSNWLFGLWNGRFGHYASGWVSPSGNVAGLDWHLGVSVGTSSLSQFYDNGRDFTSSTSPRGNPGQIAIGGSWGRHVERSACEIAEILIYNRELSYQERYKIEAYLASKYNLAGQFHPASSYIYTTDVRWRDYTVNVDIRLETSAETRDILFRVASTVSTDESFYRLTIGANAQTLAKFVSGDRTQLKATTISMPSGPYTWTPVLIELAGSSIVITVNGDVIMEVTDNSVPMGGIGLMSEESYDQFKDVQVDRACLASGCADMQEGQVCTMTCKGYFPVGPYRRTCDPSNPRAAEDGFLLEPLQCSVTMPTFMDQTREVLEDSPVGTYVGDPLNVTYIVETDEQFLFYLQPD
jgi:hypothetical protein